MIYLQTPAYVSSVDPPSADFVFKENLGHWRPTARPVNEAHLQPIGFCHWL
jgi:hypothetical protein